MRLLGFLPRNFGFKSYLVFVDVNVNVDVYDHVYVYGHDILVLV